MVTVFNDRSQSGGSMDVGTLMLMLNRYSKRDDSRGVDQPIYEENSLPYAYRVKNWYAISNYFDKNLVNDFIHQRPSIVSIPENSMFDLISKKNKLGNILN